MPFKDADEALARLLHDVPEPLAATAAQHLVPAVAIGPAAHSVFDRIGGMPLLHAGTPWPSRPAAADPWAIASRGGSFHGPRLIDLLRRERPMTFLMQVDLGMLDGQGPAADLPREDTLAFFYDGEAGPWDTGTASCRVIWTDGQLLDEVRLPDESAPAHQPVATSIAGFAPDPGAIDLPEAISRALGADEWGAEAYGDALRDEPSYPPTKLLGTPDCVQRDPRLDAAVLELFGRQDLGRDEWGAHKERIRTAALKWRLLAQFRLAQAIPAFPDDATAYFLVTTPDPEGSGLSLRKERFLLPAAYAARFTGQPRRSSG